jgi:hypothetical protein
MPASHSGPAQAARDADQVAEAQQANPRAAALVEDYAHLWRTMYLEPAGWWGDGPAPVLQVGLRTYAQAADLARTYHPAYLWRALHAFFARGWDVDDHPFGLFAANAHWLMNSRETSRERLDRIA